MGNCYALFNENSAKFTLYEEKLIIHLKPNLPIVCVKVSDEIIVYCFKKAGMTQTKSFETKRHNHKKEALIFFVQ